MFENKLCYDNKLIVEKNSQKQQLSTTKLEKFMAKMEDYFRFISTRICGMKSYKDLSVKPIFFLHLLIVKVSLIMVALSNYLSAMFSYMLTLSIKLVKFMYLSTHRSLGTSNDQKEMLKFCYNFQLSVWYTSCAKSLIFFFAKNYTKFSSKLKFPNLKYNLYYKSTLQFLRNIQF